MNLIVERTKDYNLIRTIVTHPKLYPHLCDDFSPPPEKFEPVQNDSYVYLLVRDGDDLMGFFGLQPHTTTIWEVHTCLLPGAWGDRGKIAAEMGRQWVWDNLPCIRLITNVPTYNRLAMRFAKAAGMMEFGTNPDSYVRGGKVYPMVMLGVSRPGIDAHRGEACP